MKWIVGGVLAAIVGFAVYLASYLGAFRTVRIEDGTAAPMTLLGKEHVGAYHKIVPVIEEVETWAKQHQVDCTRSFGLYLDDPADVDETRLKSFGGCVVDGAHLPELPAGFSVRTFSAPYFVKALFEGSPGIGPMKVYPKAEKHIAAKGLQKLPSVLEVYIVHSPKEMTTTYYFPVNAPVSTAAAPPAATPAPLGSKPQAPGAPARTPVPGTVVPGGPSGVGP